MPALNRFLDAQNAAYPMALAEIKNGKKRSHWMWFIFPQIKGLGASETARFYAIEDQQEATEYLKHPVLSARLMEISRVLLTLESSDAYKIFGSPDDMKLKSSMTLFAAMPEADNVFSDVLAKFYQGARDNRTLQILNIKNV